MSDKKENPCCAEGLCFVVKPTDKGVTICIQGQNDETIAAIKRVADCCARGTADCCPGDRAQGEGCE